MPALSDFLVRYPGIKLDLHSSEQFIDIVKEGFDAGIRFVVHLEKDVAPYRSVPISG